VQSALARDGTTFRGSAWGGREAVARCPSASPTPSPLPPEVPSSRKCQFLSRPSADNDPDLSAMRELHAVGVPLGRDPDRPSCPEYGTSRRVLVRRSCLYRCRVSRSVWCGKDCAADPAADLMAAEVPPSLLQPEVLSSGKPLLPQSAMFEGPDVCTFRGLHGIAVTLGDNAICGHARTWHDTAEHPTIAQSYEDLRLQFPFARDARRGWKSH